MDIGVPEVGGALAGLAGLTFMVRLAVVSLSSSRSETTVHVDNSAKQDQSQAGVPRPDQTWDDTSERVKVADCRYHRDRSDKRHEQLRAELTGAVDRLGAQLNARFDTLTKEVKDMALEQAEERGRRKRKDTP